MRSKIFLFLFYSYSLLTCIAFGNFRKNGLSLLKNTDSQSLNTLVSK